MKNKDRIEAFLKTLCRTGMQLGENILSKAEHAKAQRANGTSKTIAFEGLGG